MTTNKAQADEQDRLALKFEDAWGCALGTLQQASDATRISPSCLRDAIRRNELPVLRTHGSTNSTIRILATQLAAWLLREDKEGKDDA